MKILITGISGSGKSYLATQLIDHIDCDYFNADTIREQYNDWDFTPEGRLRQCNRMILLCNQSSKQHQIADFIAPTTEIRTLFNPDFIIWMNTTKSSKFKDTDKLYQPPNNFDIEICNFNYNLPDIIKWINYKNKQL